ncbi:hypothetical protein Slin15195_G011580 [Septoria linicola]|uniref:Uncharacterized protein n=1 Tax=Septoria linicola TaxID=215465 RepID=A0A9Q9AE57_9PEZI|nr:hypothetical protein Slin14017_G011590 [Septoria linicola]USW47839.1 hypothetical protein Slin15195_G011580 [Septoria linicola]
MSIEGCQEETSRGVVSIQLAVGIAVASSVATALVCGILWAVYGRHVARSNGRGFESAIANEHKFTRDLHERQRSADKTHQRIAPPASSPRSPTTLLAPSSQLSKCDGTSLVPTQPSRTSSRRQLIENESPMTPQTTRTNKLVSSPTTKSLREVAPQQGVAASERQIGAARLVRTTSTTSRMNHTPSVYRFAPPESIVRSRQSPPNLITEYSAVSLSGFADFAPWVSSSVLDAPETQQPRLQTAAVQPR